MTTRRLLILGSTGSIGVQTLEVVAHLNALADRGGYPERFEVVGLAARRNAALLFEQARSFGVPTAALAEDDGSAPPPPGLSVRRGPDAAEGLIEDTSPDIVLAAMVGFAGLPATLAAARRGLRIALANKETLVAAGSLVTEACGRSGAALLPVDSEHSGVWQCLLAHHAGGEVPPTRVGPAVERVVLTASGGPFRAWAKEQIDSATPEQALKHPTWSMGAKVTIDSASLTNKALELVEAHWLFGLPSARLGALVHPPSIVHAIVEFADGSVVAQLGAPDMRTPIQYALAHPRRPAGVSRKSSPLDWRSFEFEPPDTDRFPALRLGFEVIDRGGSAGAVFNAANEAAVEAFLARRIPFGAIPRLSEAALREVGASPLRDLADALAADGEARRFVASRLA
ncbi:MAG: 1-deoxy-D-xylulose-5-phosphate reductoisomerase [Phycisphaerales bacterium]|nr:1-deoxy-D-xylulose-5-phosphate reductoisomerase [Phycisphaerales bacterium]